jgi:hypothetical protein
MLYDKFLDKLPRRGTPLILAIGTATTLLLIAIPTISLRREHARLSRKITSHATHLDGQAQAHLNSRLQSNLTPFSSSPPPPPSSSPTTLLPLSASSLPQTLTSDPRTHRIFHDISTLRMPAHSLPASLSTHDLLTTYLCRTMTLFSTSLNGHLLWLRALLAGPENERRSFDAEWIESLAFEQGDRVCGVYVVLERRVEEEEGASVCFEMAVGEVRGRLVVGVVELGGDDGEKPEGREDDERRRRNGEKVFVTETWMWVPREAGVVMPTERTVPRFLHSVVSWRLLVLGTEWVQSLAR